ncbi:hypothetical protein C0991_005312, partial [Blastosporella zonata]
MGGGTSKDHSTSDNTDINVDPDIDPVLWSRPKPRKKKNVPAPEPSAAPPAPAAHNKLGATTPAITAANVPTIDASCAHLPAASITPSCLTDTNSAPVVPGSLGFVFLANLFDATSISPLHTVPGIAVPSVPVPMEGGSCSVSPEVGAKEWSDILAGLKKKPKEGAPPAAAKTKKKQTAPANATENVSRSNKCKEVPDLTMEEVRGKHTRKAAGTKEVVPLTVGVD